MAGRPAEASHWLAPLRSLEFFDGDVWWRLACAGGQRPPVGVTNGSTVYLLYSDHLGTPLALADMDGNIVQAMRYDSFGNLLETRGQAVRLPLGFAGGLFDADTGLTRAHSITGWRDYDADTGRFTALDPLGAKGGDSDWYGYCVHDPVNRVDAWGLDDGPFDFGGEGRNPADGPKYGNFCGKKWTGGWNPEQHDGKPGPLGSADSLDEKCRIHDFCWSDCDSAEDKESCKRRCNTGFVEQLKSLPQESDQWERQPPPGKEAQAENMRKAAIWWFDN